MLLKDKVDIDGSNIENNLVIIFIFLN
jgi:hypothetical protein